MNMCRNWKRLRNKMTFIYKSDNPFLKIYMKNIYIKITAGLCLLILMLASNEAYTELYQKQVQLEELKIEHSVCKFYKILRYGL